MTFIVIHKHYFPQLETDDGPHSSHIEKLIHKLIMKIEDAVNALNGLSTSTDSLSIAAEKLIAALGNEDLSPAAQAAVEKAKTAMANADAEVAKVDTLLPTPAPAGNA